MPLSATATPSSGQTPGTFEVAASGGSPPYALAAQASPPNPVPMPDYDILGPDQNGKFTVEIKDPVPRGVELFFTVTDGAQSSASVDYTSAP